MSNPSSKILFDAIRVVESMFSCEICYHDFNGSITELFGKDNLPVEHCNHFCTKVKGYSNDTFYKCLHCDAKVCHNLVMEHQYSLKTCHGGVSELIMPLIRFKTVIGIMFAGPFNWSGNANNLLHHYVQSKNSSIPKELMLARDRLTEWDNDKLQSLLPLMQLICDKLRALMEENITRGANSRRERIRFFLKKKHMDPAFNESDLAVFLELSSSRVSQLLKEYFGKSFSSLLAETRLEFAENALLSSSTAVEKIAALSGFSTTTYFYQVFKRKHHMTPTEFRNRKPD